MKVPGDNLNQTREKLFQQRPVICRGEIAIESVKHPECCIGGVIFRGLSIIGEAIGNNSFMNIAGESSEQSSCFAITSGMEKQAGERDHAIASPVGEPGITSNDSFAIGGETNFGF